MTTLHRLASDLAEIPMSTAWYLSDLAEAKGRQQLFTRQSPQRLKAGETAARRGEKSETVIAAVERITVPFTMPSCSANVRASASTCSGTSSTRSK
jgi:hypothetical protein